MRHYAPHNTHAETWSAIPAASRSTPRRLVPTIRHFIASLTQAPRALEALHANIDGPYGARDDVHAARVLAALQRWLRVTPPLSDIELESLQALSRRDATVLPSPPSSVCAACGDHLRPHVNTGAFWWHVTSLVMFWIVYMLWAIVKALGRIVHRVNRYRTLRIAKSRLQWRMDHADFYSEWYAAANALDRIEDRAHWRLQHDRANFCDDCAVESMGGDNPSIPPSVEKSLQAFCDVDMIHAKLVELSQLYCRGDVRGLAFALRASLIRNIGGMCHPELQAHSRVGTKRVVEDYVDVVSYIIAYIAHSKSTASKSEACDNSISEAEECLDDDSSVVDDNQLGINDKLVFLNEARHAYGRTALMLSGGAAMGLNHLGVVKALLDQNLLPKVVCGTSAGALVASMVGIYNDEELTQIMSTKDLINPITQQPFSFKYFDEHTSITRRIRRFMRKRCIQDVRMLQDCLRKNYGDLTFEEAYIKTHRILNITVCPHRRSSDPPLLLNYLTAPRVIIWSAASASCALPLVFAPVELVAKTANGRLVPYHPDGVRWIDGSITSDIPLSRIGELFNVNHFIVSQTNPHVIPRSMAILQTRVALLIKSELQFRYWQLLQLGLIPRLLTSIFPHFMQPYAGDVTIMPDIRLADLTTLLKNPTPDRVMSCLRRGELQTYPFLERIRLHCLIEQTLDASVEKVARAARRGRKSKGSSMFGRVPSWLWLDALSAASGDLNGIIHASTVQDTVQGTPGSGEANREDRVVDGDEQMDFSFHALSDSSESSVEGERVIC